MDKCSSKKCSRKNSSSESTSLYETDRRCRDVEGKKKISCKLSRRIRNRRNLTAMLNCSPSSTSDESDTEFILKQTSSPSSSSSLTTSSSDYTTTERDICSDYSSGSFVTSADIQADSNSLTLSSGSSFTSESSGSSTSSEEMMSTQDGSSSNSSYFTDAEPEFSSCYDSINSESDEE